MAASASTERVTWRRVAPTARSSASSLVRWATSMVKVLTMRKVPTNSAMPAQASSSWESALTVPALRSACSLARRLPVTASTPYGRIFSACCRRTSGEMPGSAFRSIWLYWPGLAKRRWAVAVSKRVRVPPAATLPSSVVKIPVDLLGADRPAHRQPDHVADPIAGALGGPLVDGDLTLGGGRPPLGERVAGCRAVVVDADGGPALADQLAVRAGERGEAGDRAGGGGDAGQIARPAEQALVEQFAGAGGVSLAADRIRTSTWSKLCSALARYASEMVLVKTSVPATKATPSSTASTVISSRAR